MFQCKAFALNCYSKGVREEKGGRANYCFDTIQ